MEGDGFNDWQRTQDRSRKPRPLRRRVRDWVEAIVWGTFIITWVILSEIALFIYSLRPRKKGP